MMEGLLKVVDMLGRTIAAMETEIERLGEEAKILREHADKLNRQASEATDRRSKKPASEDGVAG